MKKILTLAGLSFLALFAFTVQAAEDKAPEPTCPVSGKAISKDHAVAYKGAEVYFCCPNCPKAFEKNTQKFAPKANHQLVLTGQAKQVKCPVAGRPVNESKSVTVGGVEVNFCCGKCLAAAKKSDDQVTMLFGDKAFDKGFKVVESKK